MKAGNGGGEMVVTPWKVEGKIDYEKLIRQFGTQPVDREILERFRRHAGGLHYQLRRRIFFSHRDLDWIFDRYDSGEKFVLYTGRGPSGPVHLGHIVPWVFTKHLQDVFQAKLYFQLTDDEKYLYHEDYSLEFTTSTAYDNALDLIALGFKPELTRIIVDVVHIEALYHLAIKVAKHITGSTIKAVFGLKDSDNIGLTFFPAVQAVPCFLESAVQGRNVPCLIPAAIDQDPYWRVTRDIAPKLGFYKPAQIHSRFMPGLGRGGKMSASQPETCVFLVDPPEEAEKKIMNAFTGGQPTAEEQRKLGGNPEICSIYQYYAFLFEEDDGKLREIWENCRSGAVLCGDCKLKLAGRVSRFLERHQERREKLKGRLEDFLLSEEECKLISSRSLPQP
ncbi:MAG: tryptophanyl-tRNA synthetase [Candidatus Hecatellales archaeon B24]|nr:MAG: tryptophanyl-tRNA synthetase [Candidatus Hecatellales archaeon B24]